MSLTLGWYGYLEHEPKLEGVDLAAALDGLVAGVIAHVIELVLLEKVGGAGRVALVQEALET